VGKDPGEELKEGEKALVVTGVPGGEGRDVEVGVNGTTGRVVIEAE